MKDEAQERRRNLLWGIPASLILHVLVVALLLYGIPTPPQQPQEEQPVNVAIVPPPDQPKPKPVPPPPPKQPKAEKPPEQKVEKPPEQPPKPVNTPVLKPVFQYGEKDTGPEKSLDGGSAQANAPSPAKEATKPPVEPKPAPTQSAPSANPEEQADTRKADEKPVTASPDANPAQSEEKQATEDTDKQQPDKQEAAPQTDEKQAVPKPLAAEAGGKPAPPPPAEKAKPKPAKPMKFKSAGAFKAPSGKAGRSNPTNTDIAGSPIYSGLPGVRKLYSQGATGDAFATSSMENVPRDQRVANLCGNVLDQELQSADYTPKWVPTIPLKLGNVLNPPQAAFSTRTQWYNLNFRCEVDADATRVLSFNFRVGSLIPPGEWASRGFTKYPLN
ncbi:DUF930 domain-containing protein [Mesorhizobium huakuii]|uniref:DUF930 domain-containing protein n=1 Tax=Mesorhizobium huakuii TaxID=28104 RepID=A0A7G6SR73_9HYPH|nr:DUF930 domain-containing protein [Mesorhizobium huakuii]QND57005.1 DUF930 domain-containing protein [Mesorhizobium huakuii]